MEDDPTHIAAWEGDVETLRRLLASGESPDVIPDNYLDRTPLHCLCLRNSGGDRAACFELLRYAGANLEASDSIGYTPLHCAANSASVELVSLLVQARVNVDATTNHGVTALHLAARRGAPECVEVLMAAGADLDARMSPFGRKPFDMALTHRRRRTWPLFLRAGAELPAAGSYHPDPYLGRVIAAGGFKRYEQQHLARIASILETPLLPPELVRKVLEFWLHAGYY